MDAEKDWEMGVDRQEQTDKRTDRKIGETGGEHLCEQRDGKQKQKVRVEKPSWIVA